METIFTIIILITLGLGIYAGVSDLLRMQIANWISLLVVGLFFLAWFVKPEAFGALSVHLITGAVMLVVTFIFFALKAFGGGDSKLLTAFALWCGVKGLGWLMLMMAVVGGLLAVATLVLKRKPLFPNAKEGSWPYKAQSGVNAIPYGIAIAAGAITAFGSIGYL